MQAVAENTVVLIRFSEICDGKGQRPLSFVSYVWKLLTHIEQCLINNPLTVRLLHRTEREPLKVWVPIDSYFLLTVLLKVTLNISPLLTPRLISHLQLSSFTA